MKRTILVFLFFTAAFCLRAQSKDVLERVYISTDKECYVAGDYLCCSAFCFDFSGGSRGALSELSSVAYIELVSPAGVALKEKIALTQGRGSGIVKLPPELPTGNYKLVAYTRANRNESGFLPSGKDISIFNVFSADRIEGHVSIAEGAPSSSIVAPSGAMNTAGIEVFSSHSSVSIANFGEEMADLSISVFNEDSLSSLPPYHMTDFFKIMDTASFGAVGRCVIPDYEGEVIDLVSGAAGEDLILSFLGREGDFYFSKCDLSGHSLFFTGNIYGETDAFIQSYKGDYSFKGNAGIVSPFIGYYQYEYPPLVINQNMRDRLTLRGMGMQSLIRFGGDTLFNALTSRKAAILGKPDRHYVLDDYTRFASMEEVFIEFMPEVRSVTANGETEIQVLLEDSFKNSFFANSSFVMLDGIPVADKKKIMEYDPALVKEINVYTHSYTLPSIFLTGILSINTFKGNSPAFKYEDNVGIIRYKGCLYPQSLTWSKIKDFSQFPDLRQTIYWHPSVNVPPGETFDFQYVLPRYPGNFYIVIEGVTASGKPVYIKKRLE